MLILIRIWPADGELIGILRISIGGNDERATPIMFLSILKLLMLSVPIVAQLESPLHTIRLLDTHIVSSMWYCDRSYGCISHLTNTIQVDQNMYERGLLEMFSLLHIQLLTAEHRGACR